MVDPPPARRLLRTGWMIVATVGCYKGMYCGEGAEGVGRATTEAVVYSSITILISNFFLTLTLGTIFHTL